MEGGIHRKLVEQLQDVVTIIGADGSITYVSPAVEETLGYEPADLVGEIGYEYQHPDDREAVADAIEALRADPDDSQVVETRFRRADGSWCWVESTLQNRFDDPDIDGILVNSRDISERKRQEQEYQELAEEYRSLLETVEDSIFFLAVDSGDSGYTFRFERLNRAYEEQTGITIEAVQGKTPREVFGEELGAELHENYCRCMQAREPISYEEELPVETGARFWQTVLTPVITGGELTRIIGITRNITDRVKRERQLRNQKEQLDEFASVVSHDLRNPLNVAQGRMKLVSNECESEHLPPIARSLDRIDEIVTDTLTLARQGQAVSDVEAIELFGLVSECWENVRTDKATLEVVDEITIRGDRSRLHHVFENLFRNSVEHSSTGSRPEADDTIEHGGVDLAIRVGQFDVDGIYVEDTGPGIPEADREVVFESGQTSATEGTGFGLTIVKRIAEAHGWQVTLASEASGGARFEFTGVEIE